MCDVRLSVGLLFAPTNASSTNLIRSRFATSTLGYQLATVGGVANDTKHGSSPRDGAHVPTFVWVLIPLALMAL